MSDAVTEATRQNVDVHVQDVRDGLAKAADALTRLRMHATAPQKPKWERLSTKVHRVAAAVDRVLQSI
jgi:hypothetical protein